MVCKDFHRITPPECYLDEHVRDSHDRLSQHFDRIHSRYIDYLSSLHGRSGYEKDGRWIGVEFYSMDFACNAVSTLMCAMFPETAEVLIGL